MKKFIRFQNLSLLFAFVLVLLVACSKDEEDRPTSFEPINFISPDTTTIFADAGSVVDFELYLAIDQAIDSIRGAYLIDTSMMVQNLTYSDMEVAFFADGLEDSINVWSITGSLTMPTSADSVAFKPYFPGSLTPYIAPSYDAVRVIFKLEAEDNTSYEKQLKIIVN